MNKSKIYLIVQEDGDIYCAADSYELAEQIIAEDIAGGADNLVACSIIETNLWRQ